MKVVSSKNQSDDCTEVELEAVTFIEPSVPISKRAKLCPDLAQITLI